LSGANRLEQEINRGFATWATPNRQTTKVVYHKHKISLIVLSSAKEHIFMFVTSELWRYTRRIIWVLISSHTTCCVSGGRRVSPRTSHAGAYHLLPCMPPDAALYSSSIGLSLARRELRNQIHTDISADTLPHRNSR
jgi:hypothetical protein